MRIAICGGHLTPALAVLESLREKDPRSQIIFFGVKHTLENEKTLSLEFQTISQITGVEFVPLTSGKWQRYFTFKNLLTPLLVLKGFWQSLKTLHNFKPQVIMAFGSYLSVPVVIAGWVLRIPIVIHEQGIEAGIANRISSLFARRICLSFAQSRTYFPIKKAVLTGNPLRKNITSPTTYPELETFLKQNDRFPIILITGGNQGAHFINLKILEILPLLLEKYIVIHQCGASQNYQDYELLNEAVKKQSLTRQRRYLLIKNFSPDLMGAVYQKVDLVISRGGINSISELIFFQKKAIIIPLPFSAKNEQYNNALLLKKTNQVEILEQKNLVSDKVMLEAIESLIKSPTISKGMKNDVDFRLAAEKIIEEIYSQAGNYKAQNSDKTDLE
ncbi:UDP-N-acetylglucosamine--N-acetylmuramyl-(pentapeptide) pyrophosphoryl-undecaprenol N-acetylglucosamine transferase [Candidatus Microgenomates bacterium]|nr:UDP-N-acetylglucosamine--N-acetylmuramyl-(pentapeptide) pyrophosphoryl-undecaprenol N-acetylglucosamine transferase [Candidatus Microgenomates bacterium]